MVYRFARRRLRSSSEGAGPSDATLRTTGSNEFKKKDRIASEYTTSNGRMQVDGEFVQCVQTDKRKTHDVNDPWDHRNYSMGLRDSLTQSIHYPEHSKGFPRPDHQRTTGELRNASQARYSGGESRVDDLAEVGLGQLLRHCGENSKIDTGFFDMVA